MARAFSIVRPEMAGLVTRALPGEPVDVSHLASAIGLTTRVVFSAEVWAACAPTARFEDVYLAMALRDQKAQVILKAMARQLGRFGGEPLVFRSAGARRSLWLVLSAEADGWLISLA